MLAKVLSCAVVGLDGELIEVEVDRGRGLPSFVLVGLPDAAVKESGHPGPEPWESVLSGCRRR